MAMLFKKPLLRNEKVGTSELLDHSTFEESHPGMQYTKPSKSFISDRLKSESQSIDSNATSKEPKGTIASPIAKTTSTLVPRSTRSSLPDYDVGDFADDKVVDKFSVVSGLGPPWLK